VLQCKNQHGKTNNTACTVIFAVDTVAMEGNIVLYWTCHVGRSIGWREKRLWLDAVW